MIISSEQEMLDFGRSFAENLTFPAVFELVGDVGAGKTTFTRGLAAGLGVSEPVTSPSFTISKRYAFLPSPQLLQKCCKNYNASATEQPSGELIHYDFYRLDDPGIMRDELSEALSEPNSVVIVEWGDSVSDLLPATRTRLDFELNPDGTRTVKLSQGLRADKKVGN